LLYMDRKFEGFHYTRPLAAIKKIQNGCSTKEKYPTIHKLQVESLYFQAMCLDAHFQEIATANNALGEIVDERKQKRARKVVVSLLLR